jgi:hypothetical protein
MHSLQRRRTWRRRAALVLLTMPLLQTATCLDIASVSLINGFFDAVTPHLIDAAREQLGLIEEGSNSGDQEETR